MEDNFDETTSSEDEFYNYPKKASIPIKFSENETDKLNQDEDDEFDLEPEQNSKKDSTKFLKLSVIFLVFLVVALVSYVVYSFLNPNHGNSILCFREKMESQY